MKCKIKVSSQKIISKIDEKVFGSFIEHVGRSVYNGIYEPKHICADEEGFRTDVIEAVRDLNVTCVRYPGGNFVSGYDWKDGIGDRAKRPTRINLAWREREPNLIGTDEFMSWAKKTDIEPILAVSMGNSGPKEAAELVEYCNFPEGTYWSDKRRENGAEKPYGIKYWCVGNEMDGSYQMGALSAESYGKKAYEAAKQMKRVDDSVRFVMAGSSSPWSPTFPAWDKTVLNETYQYADFLSLHAYYTYKHYDDESRSLKEFLASPVNFEQYINTVQGVCDEVKRQKGEEKDIMLAVDEWNVWHNDTEIHETPYSIGEKLIENNYDFADALVVAGLLSVLVNHCDRVKIACMAQLVNVIAPIYTQTGGNMIKQTTFYPFEMFAESKGFNALVQEIERDEYDCDYGKAPYVYSSVCYDTESGTYVGYFINIAEEVCDLQLEFDESVSFEEQTVLSADLHQKNTFDNPLVVIPKIEKGTKEVGEKHSVKLSAYSINYLKWKK